MRAHHALWIAALFSAFETFDASAADTLRLSFATVRPNQTGHVCFYDTNLADGLNNQNRNIVAVWLEDDATGAYVKTLYHWGQHFGYDLEDWSLASGMDIDAVSAATQSCFSGETCGSGSNQVTAPAQLDTGAIDISGLPDATYRVRIEISSCEVADEYRSGTLSWSTPDVTFTFAKGRSSQSNVGIGNLTPFNNITLDYVVAPGNAAPGVWAGPAQSIYPANGTAIATVSAIASDDGGAPSITWTLRSVEPAGGTATFTNASALSTDVSFSASGIYTLRVTATDAQSASSHSDIVIGVNAHVLHPNADAEVYSANPSQASGVLSPVQPPAYGPWLYSWGPQNAAPCNGNATDRARGYTRFDATSVTGTIDLARVRLPIAEQRPETTKHHDLYLLADAMDDWVANQADDELTITWNNQPLANGDISGITSQLIGSYQHRTDFNTWADFDLNLGVISAVDSNRIFTFFLAARELCNGMGTASRENAVDPELIVVEHWQLNPNLPPSASASAPALVVDANGDGAEVVALTGSGSSDDIAVVLYEWTEGNVVANTADANVSLPLGVHTLQLRVQDGAGLEDRASVQVVVDDRFFPNDTPAEAEPIDGTPAGRSFANLFARSSDWFSLDLAGGGDLRIDVQGAGGDLNAVLLESDAMTAIDSSAMPGTNESVAATALAPGMYYLRVDAVAAATYSIDVFVTGAALTVALNPAQAAESLGALANAGTITLSSPATSDVVVMLSSSDLLRLALPATMLTIPTGMSSASFDLLPVDNAIADGDASITIRATATNYNSGSASFLVLDDDALGSIVHWEQANRTVSETGSPLIVLRAVLSAAAAANVVVPFTLGGTAVLGEDYRDDAGALARGSLDIPAGSTSASVIFSIADDKVDEPSETVVLTIGSPTGAVPGLPNSYTLTIDDDDQTSQMPPMPMTMMPGPPPPSGSDELTGSCGCSTTEDTSLLTPLLLLLALALTDRGLRAWRCRTWDRATSKTTRRR